MHFVAFLLFIAIQTVPTISQLSNVTFGIDEVSVLNREFVDYLLVFERSQDDNPEDQRCGISLKRLAEAYTKREQHGLECEF